PAPLHIAVMKARSGRLHVRACLLEAASAGASLVAAMDEAGRRSDFDGLKIKLVAGNSNRPLTAEISSVLRMPLTKGVCRRFADMEIFVEIQENVRGEDVFVLQSTSFPANDNLMELLILIDALKRASARRITAVIPYYGYRSEERRVG